MLDQKSGCIQNNTYRPRKVESRLDLQSEAKFRIWYLSNCYAFALREATSQSTQWKITTIPHTSKVQGPRGLDGTLDPEREGRRFSLPSVVSGIETCASGSSKQRLTALTSSGDVKLCDLVVLKKSFDKHVRCLDSWVNSWCLDKRRPSSGRLYWSSGLGSEAPNERLPCTSPTYLPPSQELLCPSLLSSVCRTL